MTALPLGWARASGRAPSLRVAGARWSERLAQWLGALSPRWPGWPLIGPGRVPRPRIIIAADTPIPGLAVALEHEAVEEGSCGWRVVLVDERGGAMGERVIAARAHRSLTTGTSVHLQRSGCTMRRFDRSVRCVDLDGFVITVADVDGVAELTDPYGSRAQAVFDERGSLVSLDGSGTVFASAFDEGTGLLIGLDETSAGGHRARHLTIVRDDRALARRIACASGDFAAEYDEAGRLCSLVSKDAAGLDLVYFDDKTVSVSQVTSPRLGAWALASNGDRGWLAVSADGHAWSLAFDAFGLLIREMTPDAVVREIERDESHGSPIVVRSVGSEVSYFYDAEGFVVYADEANGGHCDFEYDSDGRLTQTTVPGVGSFRRVFDADGRLVSVLTPEGSRELRWADDGRGVWVIGPRGDVFVALGTGRVSSIAQQSRTWSFSRDDRGYEWLSSSEGQQLYFGCASKGIERWGAPGIYDATVERDGAGRLIACGNAREVVRAGRDARGDLISIGSRCSITRDVGGRVVRIELGALVEERSYVADRLVRVRRNDSIVRQESWRGGDVAAFSAGLGAFQAQLDARGGLASIEEPVHPMGTSERPVLRSFERDEMGHIVRASRGARVSSREWRDGRLVREHDGRFELSSARDERGARVGMRSSQGLGLTMERDPTGRIAVMRCEWGGNEYEIAFRYDAAGREVERRIASLTARFVRDPLGRVLRRTVEIHGRPVDTTEYGWVGSRIRSARSGHGWSSWALEHSASGTLTAWIDARGERTELLSHAAFGHALPSVDYDARGLPLSAGGLRYDHLPGGYLRAVRSPDGEIRYAFDVLGQLAGARGRDVEIDWERDAFGRALVRTVRRYHRPAVERQSEDDIFRPASERRLTSESKLDLVWDGPRVVHRIASTGPELTHAWADGLLVMTFVGTTPYVVVPGPNGDPEGLVSMSGDRVWTRDPRTLIFGSVDEGAREYGVPSLPDHYFDAEVGLWSSLFRALDPMTARYLSPNPRGLSAGPWLHALPRDPFGQRMRHGVGERLEPFWAELAAQGFDEGWVDFVLEHTGDRCDERGLRAWRTLDDAGPPEPGRWLLEEAGLSEGC